MVSSTFSPLPATGCAAPMCVPGAIAATSAAIVIRKPADAARFPDGPTKTATGVRARMIALLMSRVESTRPPGRTKREDNERGAGSVRAPDRFTDVFSDDRMDDPVDFRGVNRPGVLALRHRSAGQGERQAQTERDGGGNLPHGGLLAGGHPA